MKPEVAQVAAAAAPSVGPAVITVFGVHIPPLALTISVVGLILARQIAPPPLRPLNKREHRILTALLLLILFAIVTGKLFGGDEPLDVGMALMWGVGLGWSGLLIIEFFGKRVIAAIKAFGQDADI